MIFDHNLLDNLAMQHELIRLFNERIASGLKRKSVTTCSRWAENYRVMAKPYPGPWTFKHHPWLKEMHDSEAELNVGQKAAQMGFTETILNITFFSIDVKGVDCLYVLPAKTPDASDFSAARFDPALEMSPHLSNMFSDVKNVGHKRAGSNNLYIRGSRSRAGLKSVPTGLIILDELDEMTEANVPLAMERAAGQVEKAIWMVSTATVDNHGINKYFLQSTQNHFYYRCPSCSRFTELTFPECLEVTGTELSDPNLKNSFYKCKECQVKLIHELKYEWLSDGKWIPSFSNRDSQGWYIPQLYSTTITPYEFAKSHFMAQTDPGAEQEFWNSKLGLPHVPEGSRVTDDDIEQCKKPHRNNEARGGSGNIVTMGVDVGKWLHVHIDEWFLPPPHLSSNDINIMSRKKTIKVTKVMNFEELDQFMFDFGISFCVIDANPERRKALEFANRFYGRVKLCFYGRGVQGKTIHIAEAEPTITVDRTSWLDLSLGRFRRHAQEAIMIPCDVDLEYRNHIKSQVRIYEKDVDGNYVGKYITTGGEDHYAHANNYSELALPMAMGLGTSHSMDSPV